MSRKFLLGSLAAAALLGMPHLARADHFFSVRSGAGNTYNVYRAVTTAMDWDPARVNAASTSFNGVQGHLASISSQVENRNVFISAGNANWYIGLTDSNATSTLDNRTLPGTEQGTSRAAWSWENGEPYSDIGMWNGGEPNDVGGEDAVQLRASDGLWNDLPTGPTTGQGSSLQFSIIEYNTELASNPMSEWRLRTYQSTFSSNPGPQITNYASADALINGVGLAPGFPVFESTIATDTTDANSSPSPQGYFAFDLQVPGLGVPHHDVGAEGWNDFVVVGTGQFQVVNPGTYTFRTTTDDGSRLRLNVNGGATQQVITDDVLSAPHDATGTIALNAGDVVDFNWMWFERGGGAVGELSYSANGTNFFLVGDDSGGLAPTTEVTIGTYKSNPGTVTTGPQILSLADADSIRNDAHLRGEAFANTVNISNDTSNGFHPFGGQAPGLTNDQDDFAVYADGFLEILTEGDYSFGTRSDDGARLIIDGVAVILDNTLHGDGNTFAGTIHLLPGYHPIEYMFFERNGGASGELFRVGPNNEPLALVGDVLNGGLRVLQVPEPSTLALGALGFFGLALGWIRKKFKK